MTKPVTKEHKNKIKDFLVAHGHKLSDLRKQKAWKAGQDNQDTTSDDLTESLLALHMPNLSPEERLQIYRASGGGR